MVRCDHRISQSQGVWRICTGMDKRPADLQPGSTSPAILDRTALQSAWDNRNNQAEGYILLQLSPQCLQVVASKSTAFDIWTELHTVLTLCRLQIEPSRIKFDQSVETLQHQAHGRQPKAAAQKGQLQREAERVFHQTLWTGAKEAVRGTPKFQYSDSVTLWLMWHFAISATLCNHLPKKSHWVATPIDHPVHVAYCLPLPCRSPFHFCALLLPSYSISIMFHILFPILSICHILPLSLFHDPLLVAMHSVPYVVPLCLGSP